MTDPLPPTPAEIFVEKYGPKVEDALETMFLKSYEKSLEGTPSHRSQYGVAYDSVGGLFDISEPDIAVKQMILLAEEWITARPGKTLVWRIRPSLSAQPRVGPVEGGESEYPMQVKLRFRAHTLQGIPEVLP